MSINNDPLFVDPVLLQRAEQACRQRLQSDPANRAVLRSLAEVQRKLGHLKDAAESYRQVFKLDPQDQEAGYLSAVLGGEEWPAAPEGIRAAPFALIPNFLPPDFHESLLPFSLSVQEKFEPVAFDGMNVGDKRDSRHALEYRGDWDRQRFQRTLVQVFRRVTPRLHLPPFELGKFEVVMRAYQDGHYFKVHRDAPPDSPFASRLVNFVYYFHRMPRPYTGGELLMFDTDVEGDTFTQARFTRVLPEDNSLIIFPCNYYHCVVPIGCQSRSFEDSRFVINGHLHRQVAVNTGGLAQTPN